MGTPVTVAIERRVDPARHRELRTWAQAGSDLAGQHPGYLGSGWVRSNDESDVWYMLYRFADEATLQGWETSDDRRWWLASGSEFVRESRSEKRTGIEGWFDAEGSSLLESARVDTAVPPPPPPRWKQAVSIWCGFFPTNLVFTLLLPFIPGYTAIPVVPRVMITTILLTPVMTYAVLPVVTRILRPWLQPTPRTAPR